MALTLEYFLMNLPSFGNQVWGFIMTSFSSADLKHPSTVKNIMWKSDLLTFSWINFENVLPHCKYFEPLELFFFWRKEENC